MDENLKLQSLKSEMTGNTRPENGEIHFECPTGAAAQKAVQIVREIALARGFDTDNLTTHSYASTRLSHVNPYRHGFSLKLKAESPAAAQQSGFDDLVAAIQTATARSADEKASRAAT